MQQKWTIHPNDVGPGSNGTDLIGCSLVEDDGIYTFIAPDGQQSPPVEPTSFPFDFPRFQSALAGKHPVYWYITVCGPEKDGTQMKGTFSNTHYVHCHGTGLGEPPDTWVAQAGPGVGEDEEDAAAASASAY